MTGFVDQFPHVGGQIAAEAQLVRCDRVLEPEDRRMECLTLESEPLKDGPELRRGASIERISQ